MSLKRRDVRRNHNDNAARRLNDPADDKGNTPKRPARLAALRRLRGTAAACAGVAAGGLLFATLGTEGPTGTATSI